MGLSVDETLLRWWKIDKWGISWKEWFDVPELEEQYLSDWETRRVLPKGLQHGYWVKNKGGKISLPKGIKSHILGIKESDLLSKKYTQFGRLIRRDNVWSTENAVLHEGCYWIIKGFFVYEEDNEGFAMVWLSSLLLQKKPKDMYVHHKQVQWDPEDGSNYLDSIWRVHCLCLQEIMNTTRSSLVYCYR